MLQAPTTEELSRYDSIFHQIKDSSDALSGPCAKDRWSAFGLSGDTLLKVWAAADLNKSGTLDIGEHRIAMHMINAARAGLKLPAQLPAHLLAAASATAHGASTMPPTTSF